MEIDMQTQTSTHVPLNLLRISPRNVRKAKPAKDLLQQLAASIFAEGQLQDLIVTEHKDGKAKHYEVEAGGRRLAAMNLLAQEGKWKKNAPVSVKIIAVEHATSASLAENSAREDMAAADQLVAFQALIDEGKTVEDVAARFGVTPTVVQRRLKLANCAPFFLDELRAGRISLEAMMALAITDDHKAQLAVWKGLQSWQRSNANAIRQLLTKDEVSIKDDAIARFVGLKAYEAAGGKVRRDLFSDTRECYLQDVALVQQLAGEKLAKKGESIREEEGWAWVLTPLTLDYSEANAYGRVAPGRREATKAEAKHLKKLREEFENLREKDDLTTTQEERMDELSELIEQAEDALCEFGPKQKAKAGVIVTVGRNGKFDIRRGLIRPEDVKASKKAKKAAKTTGGKGDADDERSFSADLTRSLSAYFTGALQAQVATRPQVALALLVHALVGSNRMGGGQLLQIRIDVPRLPSYAADIEGGAAAKALEIATQKIEKVVPEEGALTYLLEQPVETLLEWLAVLVTPGINAVTAEACLDDEAKIAARAAGLNIADWWKPTAENFFKRVNKEQLVAAAREGAGAKAEEIGKLPRKGEMVTRVEAALKDTTWVPPFVRT
jgi:ParB family transcriptional regulator, chromosome partitioning protein